MALVDVDVMSKDEACIFKIALSGQKYGFSLLRVVL